MGLIIISDAPDETEKAPELNESCIVCMAERPEGFLNDIEKIFWALNSMAHTELANADSKMCETHAKKAKGLKIHVSQDELFELDANSAIGNRPQAVKVSEEEYHFIPETDNEV